MRVDVPRSVLRSDGLLREGVVNVSLVSSETGQSCRSEVNQVATAESVDLRNSPSRLSDHFRMFYCNLQGLSRAQKSNEFTLFLASIKPNLQFYVSLSIGL